MPIHGCIYDIVTDRMLATTMTRSRPVAATITGV
jgi:hypothetical protein